MRFGEFSRAELAALAGLLDLCRDAPQVGKAAAARGRRAKKAPAACSSSMPRPAPISSSTRSNQGARAGSLLAAIDRTVIGGRRARACQPAGQPADRCRRDRMRRLDAVAYLAERPRLRQKLREELKQAPDLARALARLALGRGGPRDLGAVARRRSARRSLGAEPRMARWRARPAARTGPIATGSKPRRAR